MTKQDLFTIRPVSTADIEQIAAIESLCFPDPWSNNQLLSSTFDGYIFTALCHLQTVVGYGILDRRVDGETELLRLAIAPEFRGRRLSVRLMESLVKSASDCHAKKMMLEVRKSNKTAINLYTGIGFRQVGERKNYYKNPVDDAILMDLEI